MSTLNINGNEIPPETVIGLMDDEIREELHSIGYDNDEDFYNAYCAKHEEKYGEKFIVKRLLSVFTCCD